MIINNNQTQDVVKIGEDTSKKATINQEMIAKLQSMLTKGLYQDSVGAVITELSNNMVDSMVQSRKDPVQNPSLVEIYSENSQYFIKFTDKGLGLDKEGFETVVMNYLTSTKENDNKTIGNYGVGAKSFVALERPAEWLCRKEGKEYKFLAYLGAEFLEYDLLSEKETTEENGVEIKIRINNWSERCTFVEKAKTKLAYYDEVVLVIDGKVWGNKIYRHEKFQYCDATPYQEMHFTLKDVVYKIDWNQIGISTVYLPVALRFSLDDGITPTISREAINYNEFSKNLIRERVKEVLTLFIKKYNETTHYPDLRSAWSHIDSGICPVQFGNETFYIETLDRHTDVKIKNVTVEGVKLLDLKSVRRNLNEMFYNYTPIAYETYNEVWKKDKISKTITIKQQVEKKGKIVVVNESLIGNLKEYIRNENPLGTLYLIKNTNERTLGYKLKDRWKDNTYYSLLDLKDKPRSDWRYMIDEWNLLTKEMTSVFVEQFDIESSGKYQNWLAEKKQVQKEAKANGTYTTNYVSLNKAKGDITIMTARKHVHSEKLSWDKAAVPIGTLHQRQYLTVYFHKDRELPEDLYNYFKYVPNIRFVQLNPSEVRHIKGLHNFITMSELTKTRPFQRFVTALLADELLDLEPENADIIYEAFPKYKELKRKIEAYKISNTPLSGKSSAIAKTALEEAKFGNLWDMNIYPELQEFRSIMDKFGFLNFLKMNGGYEETKIANNMLYIMLKNRKVTGKNVDDLELVPKGSMCFDPEQVKAEEELYSQYENVLVA